MALTVLGAWGATRLGTEFIPSLDECDVAVQASRIPGTSLTQSIALQTAVEKAALSLPEVHTAFSRIGTAEVATDPMPPSIADGIVMLKPRASWPDPAKPKEVLLEELDAEGAQPRPLRSDSTTRAAVSSCSSRRAADVPPAETFESSHAPSLSAA